MGRGKKKESGEVEHISDMDILVNAIEKMGSNVLSSIDELAASTYLSTGIYGLDYALGSRGIPSTSIVECHAVNGLGKSSLALHIANKAIESGMNVFYIDTEFAINESTSSIFIKHDGVNWVQPESGEKALDIIKHIVKNTTNSFIVLDSIGGTVPSVIADGDSGSSHMAVQARLFMQFGPTCKVYCRKNNNILLAINQESSNMGKGYNLAGGKKWSYVPDLRMRMTKRFPNGDITVGDERIGHIIKTEVTKNRYGPPFRTAYIPLVYGSGFDVELELVENAISFGVMNKKASWISYEYGDQEIKMQGLNKMASWLKENPEAKNKVVEQLDEILT